MQPSFTSIQRHVLRVLSGLEPRWTLTGGGALGRLPGKAAAALLAEGMEVRFVQRAPAFCRLLVQRAGEELLVDLVAEPVANVFPTEHRQVDGAEVLLDRRAEILVNKLGALYSRWEIRDLVDVKALVEAGEDLDAAIRLVSRKDGGFSPPDLAWVLRSLNVARVAAAERYDGAALVQFRDALVERLLA